MYMKNLRRKDQMQRKDENYKFNEVECESVCMYTKNLKKGPDAKERLYKNRWAIKISHLRLFNKI